MREKLFKLIAELENESKNYNPVNSDPLYHAITEVEQLAMKTGYKIATIEAVSKIYDLLDELEEVK